MRKLVQNLVTGDILMNGADKSGTVATVKYETPNRIRVTMADGQDWSMPPNTYVHVRFETTQRKEAAIYETGYQAALKDIFNAYHSPDGVGAVLNWLDNNLSQISKQELNVD